MSIGSDRRLARDLERLIRIQPDGGSLPAVDARPSIEGAIGEGLPEDSAPARGGLVPPFVVRGRESRQETLVSADGGCEIDVEIDLRLRCEDGAGQAFWFILRDE